MTVPADATAAVAFWCHWDSNGGTSLATLALAGSPFAIRAQVAEGAVVDANGVGVATLVPLPGTGAQTLSWTWSGGGARTEGGEIVVVWVKDHNTVTVYRDADVDARAGNVNATTTIDVGGADLVIGFGVSVDGDPALDAASVFIDGASLNLQVYDVGEYVPSGPTVTVATQAPNHSSVAAISLPPATSEQTRRYQVRRSRMTSW